jgi:hypothetical protein
MNSFEDSLDQEKLLQRHSEDDLASFQTRRGKSSALRALIPEFSMNITGFIVLIFSNIVFCVLILKLGQGDVLVKTAHEGGEYFCMFLLRHDISYTNLTTQNRFSSNSRKNSSTTLYQTGRCPIVP